MREYTYRIKDPLGLHARPASAIFKEARKYTCAIEAAFGDEKADAKNLLALLGLGANAGGELAFRFEGEDEDEAAEAVNAMLCTIWFEPVCETGSDK